MLYLFSWLYVPSFILVTLIYSVGISSSKIKLSKDTFPVFCTFILYSISSSACADSGPVFSTSSSGVAGLFSKFNVTICSFVEISAV